MWQSAATADTTFTSKLQRLAASLRDVAEVDARKTFPSHIRGRFRKLLEESAYFHRYLTAAGVCSKPAPAAAEPAPSSAERTTGAERTRDERGVPVIPGLKDAGALVFDVLWSQALEMPMDDAVSRLEGVLELIQYHPALAPEAANLRRLCAAWWALVPGKNTCRLATFELRLEGARRMKMGDAVSEIAGLATVCQDRPELDREDEQLYALWDAWELLNESPVLVRSRTL